VTSNELAALTALNDQFARAVPSAYGLGVRFVELRRGFVRAAVPFASNGNHFGVMYAGAIFTVAEVLGGALGLSTFDATLYYPLVKSMTVDFLAPSRSDVTARTAVCDEEITRIEQDAATLGKASFELVAEVHDTAGELVARTRGDYQLRAYDYRR
jgi:acyl-coenzyme A thioesterase PaaI-like protein